MTDAWRRYAACDGMSSTVFFHHRDDAAYREARRVCAGCPVRPECLEHALERKEDEGCWGGLNPKERRSLLRRRQRRRAA